MFIIYAQAAQDARPRASDRMLDGVRLQFLGVRATRGLARDAAQRASMRVDGIAGVYTRHLISGIFCLELFAKYVQGRLVDVDVMTAPTAQDCAAAQQRDQNATGYEERIF